jgi:4-hydroxy-tetrahydrodipicolinate reductase
MDSVILGGGRLGGAIAATLVERGDPPPRILGRPAGGRHEPRTIGRPEVVFEASSGEAVAANVDAALAAGCRRFVIATTGWAADRDHVEAALRSSSAAAVVASNLSVGAELFGRLVERAADLFGPIATFDAVLWEWHRRGKSDRPSGTAQELARRVAATGRGFADLEVVAIRAGSSPGVHTLLLDAPGETVELRLTARDRTAYAAGAIAAARWLTDAQRRPGSHPFAAVVDDLLTDRGRPTERPATAA